MNIIVVVDENWSIGRDGALLVHLPGDLKYFKEKTLGKTVVVGRKTLESFPSAKPLPGRRNIVLTRQAGYQPEGCEVCTSKEELMTLLGSDTQDVFISGGQEIYKQFLQECDRYFVTKLYAGFEADRSFPELDSREDVEVVWKSGMQEEKGVKYQFFEYRRK